MKKVGVPTNAGRLIHAVARIGYDTEVALCDLIDNCIDADATSVRVGLRRDEHEQEGQSDTIAAYQISDDGIGMDEETLLGAFTLGTPREYRPGSLGKFGLGLKSAGLSLGSEITILTQKEGCVPLCARLSMFEVEQSGKYEVDLGEIPETLLPVWNSSNIDGHGTTLLIRDLTDGHPPHSTFQDYLRRYCATIYHRFMEKASPLSIEIGGMTLEPFDPLFLAEARKEALIPQTWDGLTPHLLLEDEIQLGESVASIAATHLVHPPSFGPNRRKAQDEYGIVEDPYTRRPRHGFYVYRNDRVIVLAERFRGLVPAQQQSYAFKARLMFDESADAILSLDVKKRHCQLPKDVRQNLKAAIDHYVKKSSEAWREAGQAVMARSGETIGSRTNEGIATTTVPSLDYMPGNVPDDDASLKIRKERQESISEEARAAVQDPQGVDLLEKGAQDGDAVIPVEGLRSNAMWWPYPAVTLNRAETLVNTQHTWVAEAYRAAEHTPNITVVLHHFFTILARAELEVRAANWPDVGKEQVDLVFDRFRKRTSTFGEDLAEGLADMLADGEANDAVE